jgi:hypothetical protein
MSGRKKKTHEDYEKELFSKEIDYYPLEEYEGALIKILHECLLGHKWKITPHNILHGIGCPSCKSLKQTKTSEGYNNELVTKGIQYIPIEPYINARTKITHICKNNHEWKITPSDILSGYGCPKCSKRGFNPSKPAILYYIKITKKNLTYYKIGITNNSVKHRFKEDLSTAKIDIIREVYYKEGVDAKNEEARLLMEFKKHRQNIPELLISGGNTELFEFDILELDN